MFSEGLVLSRFLHYAGLLTLFGVSLFPLYAYRRHTGDWPAELTHWMKGVLFGAALVSLGSGIFWFFFAVVTMTGTVSDAVDRETLRSVVSDMAFGKVWLAHLMLVTMALLWTGLVFLTRSRETFWLAVALATASLISLAGVGHTQVNDGLSHIVHMVADGAHLLAAGAWLGGLIPLLYLLAITRGSFADDSDLDIGGVLIRFSGMGYAAVAVLLGSGLINSWYLVGSVGNAFVTPYGQLLILKLILFGGMLLLAAANRFWLVPELQAGMISGNSKVWFRRLRRHILGEQTLGLLVLLIVSVLGTMEPAISSAKAHGV